MTADARLELEMMHHACAEVRCPYCGAAPGQVCVNPINDRPAKVPHLARVRTADEQP